MKKYTLLEVESELIDVHKEKEAVQKEYEKAILKLNNNIRELEYKKKVLMSECDISRIENAKRFLYTIGCKNNFYGEASIKVEEAIRDVTNGCKIMLVDYLGCKDYGGFTGQGIRCKYGYRPKHGHVKMEIGTTQDFRTKKVTPIEDDYSDMIYFLNLLKIEEYRKVILREGE